MTPFKLKQIGEDAELLGFKMYEIDDQVEYVCQNPAFRITVLYDANKLTTTIGWSEGVGLPENVTEFAEYLLRAHKIANRIKQREVWATAADSRGDV